MRRPRFYISMNTLRYDTHEQESKRKPSAQAKPLTLGEALQTGNVKRAKGILADSIHRLDAHDARELEKCRKIAQILGLPC